MRPTNPTPGHAFGNGTPTPLRPTNPTPLQASTAVNPSPSNPTPKQSSESLSQESPIQEDPPHWTTNLESVQEVEVPPSAGEDVAGPIETEDPEEDENVPVFSGKFESTFLLCGQTLYTARIAQLFKTMTIFSAAEMTQIGPRSLYFDVTGEARTQRVKMPNCILGGKPGALPNTPVGETQ